jgi:sugar lactone lactonase YvrE
MFSSKRFSQWRTLAAQALVAFSLLLALAVLPVGSVPAQAAPAKPFPEVIPLPNGFQPEGIVAGRGTDFYVGSLATGAVYKGNLRTGQGDVLVPPHADRIAVGLAFDPRTDYLFVAGGPTGQLYVYDTASGADVADFQLAAPGTGFINDVIVTGHAAYVTNSFDDVLYKLPLAPNGALPDPSEVEEIDLPDEFENEGFNANGIEATPNGKLVVIVHSGLGALYRFDTESGEITQIDLGGGEVPSGDGLLLQGRTLYVVQNFLNQIAVVELDPDLRSGEVVDTLTDPDFRIPTTVAGFGNALYAVNARFDVADPDMDTEYKVVKLCRR